MLEVIVVVEVGMLLLKDNNVIILRVKDIFVKIFFFIFKYIFEFYI